MGKVDVYIFAKRGKVKKVALPGDSPMRKVVSGLVSMMNLPTFAPNGSRQIYFLLNETRGELIGSNQTLSSAGVRDNDKLYLVPQFMGRASSSSHDRQGIVKVDITVGTEYRRNIVLSRYSEIHRAIAGLIERMGLPVKYSDGQEISYTLIVEKSGMLLGDKHSLADAGVKDEDKVRLVPVAMTISKEPDSSPPSTPALAFISYRREGASEIARAIQAGLLKFRISISLDVDDQKYHYFDEGLLLLIKNALNFILVLTPGCLDGCVDEEDWMRREIMHAYKMDRNIIPIWHPKFMFPDISGIPRELLDLKRIQSIQYSHKYYWNMIEELVEKLKKS